MPPDLKSDWRLTNQAKYLTGVTLRLSRFHVSADRPEWDHEHCEFCWAKIVEGNRKTTGEELLVEAYTTEDRICWVCPKCFEDFREMFQWKIVT
jgi:hypothetical protein